MRFLKFLKKAEADQKYEYTDLKLRKLIKNMRKHINLKAFEKRGNGLKK